MFVFLLINIFIERQSICVAQSVLSSWAQVILLSEFTVMALSTNHGSFKKYFWDHIEHVILVLWCLERLPLPGPADSSEQQVICPEHTFDFQTSQSGLLFSIWFLHFSTPLLHGPPGEQMARVQLLLTCLPTLCKAPNLNPAHLPPHPTHSTEASEAFVCAFPYGPAWHVSTRMHSPLPCLRGPEEGISVFLSNSTYSLETKFLTKLETCCFV